MFHIPKLKSFEYSAENDKIFSKENNINLSQFKKEHNLKLSTEIKINKTVQSKERNNFFDSSFKIKSNSISKINNYKSFLTLSSINSNYESFKNIHSINMDKIITFTNTAFYSKSPKFKTILTNNENENIKEQRKTRNNKFNSLECFIDDYMSKENNDIKKYKTNFRDFFGDSDYEKLIEKEKTYLTEMGKIRLIYKNTRLMKALFDYLNLSLGKIKNKRNQRIKEINKSNEENRKKKKYMQFIEKHMRLNLIPYKDVFNNNHKNNLKFQFNKRSPLIYKNGYLSNHKD